MLSEFDIFICCTLGGFFLPYLPIFSLQKALMGTPKAMNLWNVSSALCGIMSR